MADAVLAPTQIDSARQSDRFDPVTIAMHWGALLLLIVTFAAAWTFGRATDPATAERALLVHRSAGGLVWGLTLIRLGWKYRLGRAAPLPPTVGRFQRAIARANQYGLYALLVLQPVTGLLQSLFRGKPFPLLGFTVPALLARDRRLTKVFHNIHEISAWALLALIALHASAALFHHFALRDDVLRAMLPRRRRAVDQDCGAAPGARRTSPFL
jgi:cytochrome b561